MQQSAQYTSINQLKWTPVKLIIDRQLLLYY